MKKCILIIMLTLAGTILDAQNCFWAKNAGGIDHDWSQSVTTDINGDVYVTGYFQSSSITFESTTITNSNPGSYAYFVVKYSPGGNVIWARGATGTAFSNSITSDIAGNIYVIGYYYSNTLTIETTTLTNNGNGYEEIFIVKYDSDGNCIWAKSAGGDQADGGYGIATDAGGNVYITGMFYSASLSFGSTILTNNGTGNSDFFIAKYDSNGDPVWAQSMGGSRYEYGNDITTFGGKIYVTGNFQSDSVIFGSYKLYNDEPGNDVLFMTCYDNSGNVIWAKEADGLWGSVTGNGITHDFSGNIYVSGENYSDTLVLGNDTLCNFSPGSSDIYLAKYSSGGNVIWARCAGGFDYDYCNAIAVDSVGNNYITGYFNSNSIVFENDTILNSSTSSYPEIFIAEYDSLGDMLWAKKAGGTSTDISEDIATGTGDNVYFTGTFHTTAVFGDVTLITSGNSDMFVADIYNFNSGIVSYTDATCNGTNNGTAFATASEGNLPYIYLWNTTPPETTSSVMDLPAGNFTVTISEAYGCAQTHSVTIGEPPADTAAICMVTVDSMSMYNIIVWDKTPFTRVDTFMVCREISTNNYQPIARIPYSAPSQFIDTVRTLYFPNTGNPNEGTYRYKIMLHDTCGQYGDLSPYHNTIYFLNNNGTFYWTLPYTIENGPNPVANYILMRDDSSNGNWHDVTSVAGTQQVISDPLYTVYQNIASWRVKTQWSITCTPTLKDLSSNYSTSISNIFSNYIPVGIIENSGNNLVNMFPNPANDKLEIILSEKSEVEILNVEGQVLKNINAEDSHVTIDVSCFAKGMYFVKVKNEDGLTVKKFVKD
jgi:hypothetical protein